MENPEIKSVDNFSRTPSRSSMLTKISRYYRLYLYIYIFLCRIINWSPDESPTETFHCIPIECRLKTAISLSNYFIIQCVFYSLHVASFHFSLRDVQKVFDFHLFSIVCKDAKNTSIESSHENWQKLNEFRKFKLNLFSSAQYVFV